MGGFCQQDINNIALPFETLRGQQEHSFDGDLPDVTWKTK